MNAVFDPMRRRRLLDGDSGYEWVLTLSFEEARRSKGLTHGANFNLNWAIECILVGYYEPADRLVKRAVEWLTIAAEDEEQAQRFPIWQKAQRHYNLAQCAWLMRGVRDPENLELFLEHGDRVFADPDQVSDRTNVSLAIVNYVDAGDDRRTLDLLLRAGIGPPSSFDAIRSEGQMAYVICRKRLGDAYGDDDVDRALAAFLKRNVNKWLIDGDYMRAAQWMKVAHWREGGATSPQEAVRRCYDYLPGVAPPAP